MTTTDNRGRSLTTAEAEAVILVRAGRSRPSAAQETGLTLEEVGAALERANSHRAQRIVPQSVPSPRERATVPAAAARIAVAQKPEDGVDALLHWAEGSDMPRAHTLAVRARGIIDELVDLHRRGEKIRVAKKTITDLERQLKKAKAELRQASGKPSTPAGKGAPDDRADREERDRIRAWARENDHPVADRGKIPEPVAAAYRAATGTP